MKLGVLGLLLVGTATVGVQTPILARADLEIPLLIVWGMALLALGQRVKTVTSDCQQQTTPRYRDLRSARD